MVIEKIWNILVYTDKFESSLNGEYIYDNSEMTVKKGTSVFSYKDMWFLWDEFEIENSEITSDKKVKDDYYHVEYGINTIPSVYLTYNVQETSRIERRFFDTNGVLSGVLIEDSENRIVKTYAYDFENGLCYEAIFENENHIPSSINEYRITLDVYTLSYLPSFIRYERVNVSNMTQSFISLGELIQVIK